MTLFPRIGGACPYQHDLSSVVSGEWCRMCKRTVVDLTDLSESDKVALFAGCADDVPCVSYRFPAAIAAATLAVASANAATPAKHHPAPHTTHKPTTAAPPVIITTAGVPALPVQWASHPAEPAPAMSAKAAPPPP